jgi:hypothetical protein
MGDYSLAGPGDGAGGSGELRQVGLFQTMTGDVSLGAWGLVPQSGEMDILRTDGGRFESFVAHESATRRIASGSCGPGE